MLTVLNNGIGAIEKREGTIIKRRHFEQFCKKEILELEQSDTLQIFCFRNHSMFQKSKKVKY